MIQSIVVNKINVSQFFFNIPFYFLERRNVTSKKSLFQISYDFTYHEANVTLGFVSLKKYFILVE